MRPRNGGSVLESRFERLHRCAGRDDLWLVVDRFDRERKGLLKLAVGGAEREALEREMESMLELNHPALRELWAREELPSGASAAVMAWVDGVDLQSFLQDNPDRVLSSAAALLRCLLHFHGRGRVHGDLKPENVLIDGSGRLRLIDLGLSAPLGGTPLGGTRPFLAPEYERGAPLSVAGELYAFGRTLEAAAGESRERWPDALDALIRQCSSPDPEVRPASVDAALGQLGVQPRPFDRQGRLPLSGLDEVLAACHEAVSDDAGRALILRGGRGSGRTGLVKELRRGALRGGRKLFEASFATESHPLSLLREQLVEHGAGERSLGEVVAEGLVAAAKLGATVLVDELDRANREEIEALALGISALARFGRGGVILVGAEAEQAERLVGAGGRVLTLPRLGADEVAALMRRQSVRADAKVVESILRGSEGRIGVVCELVREVAEDPRQDLRQLEERGRARWAAEPSESHERLPRDEALARARRDLEARAGETAAERLRGSLPELDVEPGRDVEAAMLLARAEATAGHLEEAVGIYEALGEATPLAGRLERCRLVERLGRYEQARELGVELLQEPSVATQAAVVVATAAIASGALDEAETGLRLGAASAKLDIESAQLEMLESDLALRRGQTERAAEVAEAALARLESVDGPVDPKLLAASHSRLASIRSLTGDIHGARDGHALALRIAEGAGDVAGLAPYVMNLATATHASGELAAAISLYEEAMQLARVLGRRAMVAAAATNLAGLFVSVGATKEAEAVLGEAREAAEASGSAIYSAQAKLIEAELVGSEDRARGRRLARRAGEAFEACGATRQVLEAELCEAELFYDGAMGDAASRWLEQREAALERSGLAPRAALLAARVALEGGNLDEALGAAERAVGLAEEAEDRLIQARALTVLVGVHERLGTGGDEPLRQRVREVLATIAARLPSGLRERFLASFARETGEARHGESRGLRSSARRARGLGIEARRLLALVRRVLLEGDERRLLTTSLDEVVELTRAERAFLLLRRGAKSRDDVVVARNLDGESIRKKRSGYSRSVADQVIASGEPIVTAMAKDDPKLRGARSVLDLGLRSILCVPVRGPESVVGAFYLDHRFREGRFGEAELELVQSAADIIGLALENARLHREAREREQELERANEAVSRENLRRAAELERMSERLSRATAERSDAEGGIVGRSSALKRALELAARVAPSDLPVLITGESGTGKELFARFVHERSLRADGPFLAVNCSAIPETLLESELFGHLRGAFTGATQDQPGLFRAAKGGTVMLDEIGEMPPRMQTKLLRVLQERRVRPLGGTSMVDVDVRIIAATNRDLNKDVEDKRFRQDLYYRLVGVELGVPPLRERLEDLPLLVEALLERISEEPGMRRARIGRDALALLLDHDWPGNVRELEQTLRRAVLIAEGDELMSIDLALEASRVPRRVALRRYDEQLVRQALAAAKGNRTVAARALGVSRVTIHRWIKRYGL